MKPERALLKYFLVYAMLVISWLLASYTWLSSAQTAQNNAQAHLVNIAVFAVVSIIFWFVILQRHSQEKKRQYADATLSLERLKLALDAAQEALWDWSLNEQQEVYFSTTYCANLGYTQEEFGSNQQAWQSRLLPEERERIYRTVMRFIAEGDGNYDSTYRMRHKDNSLRWIRSRGRLVKNSAGEAIRFIGIAQDITAQR